MKFNIETYVASLSLDIEVINLSYKDLTIKYINARNQRILKAA